MNLRPLFPWLTLLTREFINLRWGYVQHKEHTHAYNMCAPEYIGYIGYIGYIKKQINILNKQNNSNKYVK